MNAFVLAAGLGTRLRPLTDTMPKALVPVLGVPLLDRLRAWLARGGVTALALNTHHLAQRVEEHLRTAAGPLAEPRLYHEPALLGTGGGVRDAADFWGEDDLLVWNADIVAAVAPRALLDVHRAPGGGAGTPPVATLAVQARPGDSRLIVDTAGMVCGIDSPRRGRHALLRPPTGDVRGLAFNGVSVLAPALRAHMPPDGAFDLVEALLAAVVAGAVVRTLEVPVGGFFGTTGTPEQLRELEARLAAEPKLLADWTP